jgi:hypothetical protein
MTSQETQLSIWPRNTIPIFWKEWNIWEKH